MKLEKEHKIKLLKPIDYVIIGIALTLIFFSLVSTKKNINDEAKVILSSPEGEWVYPLDTNQTIGAHGTIGVSVITLENGTAFFASSPCDNQVCVLSHPVSSNASFIACLPNQVFLRIEAKVPEIQNTQDDNSLDAIGF